MGDDIPHRKNVISEINGRNSGDPLFGKVSNGKTSAQIISEAKASVYQKKTSDSRVIYFRIILKFKSHNILYPVVKQH